MLKERVFMVVKYSETWHVKAEVYRTPPTSVQDIRRRIVNAFNNLRRSRMVRRAMDAMTVRAQRCIRLGGRHMEGRAIGV